MLSLIRRHNMWHLICICTVCLWPFYGFPELRACGSSFPVQIDTDYQDCVDGHVVNISTTRAPPREKIEPTPPKCPNNEVTTTEDKGNKKNRSPPAPEEFDDHRLDCLLSIHTDQTSGRQCCGGFKTYHPGFDTCCMKDAKHAIVHSGKPERSHACCPDYGTYDDDDIKKVYRRGSRDIPCLHPSLNDKFWQSPQKLKKMMNYCNDYKYAYHLRIRKLINVTRTTLVTCYNATLKRRPWYGASEIKIYSKCIPIDKHSPKGKLSNKNFAVLTNHDYQLDLDFYLDLNPETTDKEDMVFKGPNIMRKFSKNFKKIHRKCQKSKRSKSKNIRQRPFAAIKAYFDKR